MAYKQYFVYIIAGHSRTLYVGLTNNLRRRALEHKRKVRKGYTEKYRVDQLVWFEQFSEILQAIAREKQIKGWSRAKKIALIEAMNPSWLDYARELNLPPPDPSLRSG
jgi:putative endonuclease